MKKYTYLNIFILFFFLLLYYFIPLKFDANSQTLLSISTVLFAIFTGFFISRQGVRYSSIRDQITTFDGEMSSMYRKFGHLDKGAQKQMVKIIKKHYQAILKNKSWDYHFINKSSTLTDTHNLLEKITQEKIFKTLKSFATQRILVSLENLQLVRKKMVALRNERIPKFQWTLIYFLALILLMGVSTIPSQYNLFSALLKAAFSSSIIFVIILLYEFDRLHFFEGTMGEKSAQDILDILANRK